MSSPSGSQGNFWQTKSPILKFLLGFAVSMALFYLFYYSSIYESYLAQPIEHFQASISSGILNIMGYGTTVVGDSIKGNDFSVHIAKGCDGLEPLAMLTFAILMFPIAFKYKWRGLAACIGLLFILNIIRIVGLFLSGIYIPKAFDFLHLHGGFVIFTILTIVIWMMWANWAMGQMKNEASLE